jgi:hypothetical protein
MTLRPERDAEAEITSLLLASRQIQISAPFRQVQAAGWRAKRLMMRSPITRLAGAYAIALLILDRCPDLVATQG